MAAGIESTGCGNLFLLWLLNMITVNIYLRSTYKSGLACSARHMLREDILYEFPFLKLRM